MGGRIERINIKDLLNYFENPRHAIGSTETDTLKKLFEAVGVQYMFNLAEDIQKHGLLGNQQVVAVYSSEKNAYVVYEGNRRIAAIKLLLSPGKFSFLDPAVLEKAKRIASRGNVPTEINCYVTDEQDAFFIMERLHSGEDRGRGTKQWTSREKEAFRVRQSNQKKISYLIDVYIKKHLKDEITAIIPFTTIERIFNNREVKRLIGLEVDDEGTFTKERMQLVLDASKWIADEARSAGMAVTRLFNKSKAIEEKLLPWINEYIQEGRNNIESNDSNADNAEDGTPQSDSGVTTNNDAGEIFSGENDSESSPESHYDKDTSGEKSKMTSEGQKAGVSNNGSSSGGSTGGSSSASTSDSAGGNKNIPYFFQGLDYSCLDPHDAASHGVSSVCRELQMFSDKRLVDKYPIASAFLVRAVIEQAIIYYSKKHNITGQTTLIWDSFRKHNGSPQLSKIIDKYNKSLEQYIAEKNIREYFSDLFGDYNTNIINPLNWVVHRPAEFQLDSSTLVELPRKGLLAVINYMLS